MELEFNRSFQWGICLLHRNELSLRLLLNTLDCVKFGSTYFCGTTGTTIKTYEQLHVASFSSIRMENMQDNIDRMVLNNDKQNLYDICITISRGEFCSNLALKYLVRMFTQNGNNSW